MSDSSGSSNDKPVKPRPKWASLLSTAPAALAAPLTVKSFPKWVNDELKRRTLSGETISDQSEDDVDTSIRSVHSEGKRKRPLVNFIHFSPLMCTYVCLSSVINYNDLVLRNLGPDVLRLLKHYIGPLSLYGKVIRESGDHSLFIKFQVVDEALTHGGNMEAIRHLSRARGVPCVCDQKIMSNGIQPSCLSFESSYASFRQGINLSQGCSKSELKSSAYIWESENCVSGGLSALGNISSLPIATNYFDFDTRSEGVATVCFSIPAKYCVPLIQRMLEKMGLMNIVYEAIEMGQLAKAIKVLTQFLEIYTVEEWKENARIEGASAYAFRAHLHTQMGSFENAVNDSRIAIELDPRLCEGYTAAVSSYIARAQSDFAESVASICHKKVQRLPLRFIRGSLLCHIVGAFHKWRTSNGGNKIRLEVLPLSAAVRFSASRYIKANTAEEVSIADTPLPDRNAALDSYFTHPLKHPNHPGIVIGTFADLEKVGLNGFPDSSEATGTWINCVYSSTIAQLKNEMPDFCCAPMYYNCRVNRVHATRPFPPKTQILDEKISVLLPLLSMKPRLRIGDQILLNPTDSVSWCNYCGVILQTEASRGNPAGCTVCTLGCGTTYCSEECHDRAAGEYHWIECPRSIVLNIGPVQGARENWTAVSFTIRRAFLLLEHFISGFVSEVKLTKRSPLTPNEKPDPIVALAIAMRLYKHIVASILSFVLWPLLGIHPMSSYMEEQVNVQSAKLDALLRELDLKKITPDVDPNRYNVILAEKIFQMLDIPFMADINYYDSPTVAEELNLCPSLSLIPQVSARDALFTCDANRASAVSIEVKNSCAAAIWTFSQSIAAAIHEHLLDAPLPTQRFLLTEPQFCDDLSSTCNWKCYSFLNFLGSLRFMSQFFDFCCTSFSIAEVAGACTADGKSRDSIPSDFIAPVVVISPHLSIITDLGDFAGNYAHSRYCFEHEISLHTINKGADDSLMSLRSFVDSDPGDIGNLSINSMGSEAANVCDPSPWIQWCSSIAAGCTNIETPSVFCTTVNGFRERRVSVYSCGGVKPDDMVRLKSVWCCS